MSFVHYLYVGHLDLSDPRRGSAVRPRVLRPLSEEQVHQIAAEVERRYGLRVDLLPLLTKEGALRATRMGNGPHDLHAEHVALVALDLFGTQACGDGESVLRESLEQKVPRLLAWCAEQRRIESIEDPSEQEFEADALVTRFFDQLLPAELAAHPEVAADSGYRARVHVPRVGGWSIDFIAELLVSVLARYAERLRPRA